MRLLMKESYTVDYAGFWWRLAAVLIDGIILWAFNYVLTGVWNVATGIPWSSAGAAEIGDTFAATATHVGWRWFVFILAFAVYFLVFWAWRGQTPGKMLTRLKITTLDGSNIGWNGALVRFIGYIASIVFLFVGLIWVAFDTRKQGLPDKMANTYVIRVPPKGYEAEVRSAR